MKVFTLLSDEEKKKYGLSDNKGKAFLYIPKSERYELYVHVTCKCCNTEMICLADADDLISMLGELKDIGCPCGNRYTRQFTLSADVECFESFLRELNEQWDWERDIRNKAIRDMMKK